MNLKKGQVAMEFLMTYGWAVLAVSVALGALWYLGVFDFSTPNECTVASPFVCHDVAIDSDTGSFSITLSARSIEDNIQNQISSISINNQECLFDGALANKALVTGDYDVRKGPVTFTCTGNFGSSKDAFKSIITLNYQKPGRAIVHTVKGKASGTIEGSAQVGAGSSPSSTTTTLPDSTTTTTLPSSDCAASCNNLFGTTISTCSTGQPADTCSEAISLECTSTGAGEINYQPGGGSCETGSCYCGIVNCCNTGECDGNECNEPPIGTGCHDYCRGLNPNYLSTCTTTPSDSFCMESFTSCLPNAAQGTIFLADGGNCATGVCSCIDITCCDQNLCTSDGAACGTTTTTTLPQQQGGPTFSLSSKDNWRLTPTADGKGDQITFEVINDLDIPVTLTQIIFLDTAGQPLNQFPIWQWSTVISARDNVDGDENKVNIEIRSIVPLEIPTNIPFHLKLTTEEFDDPQTITQDGQGGPMILKK